MRLVVTREVLPQLVTSVIYQKILTIILQQDQDLGHQAVTQLQQAGHTAQAASLQVCRMSQQQLIEISGQIICIHHFHVQ